MKLSPRFVLLAIFAGVLGGLTSAVFLTALGWVARKQADEAGLFFLLPIIGLLVGGLYDRFGGRATRGTNLIIEEIHTTQARTPGRTTPLVFFTTLLSHIGGASVGREGAAVQMSASLSDQLSRFFHLSLDDRRVLLKAGSAAGFAGALGAPIAGVVFGLEVLTKGLRFKLVHGVECAIAAATAFGIVRWLGVEHTVYGRLAEFPIFSPHYLLAAVAFGLLTGLIVRVFIVLTEILTHLSRLLSERLAVRAFLGGGLVLLLVAVFGNRDSLGLGIPQIQATFLSSAPLPQAFEKLVLTAVSIASGFRGGEFVPLLFMGASAGSAAAGFLSVPPAFAAACGLTASFGSAARVPLALSVFAAEHFFPGFFLHAVIANLAARMVVGREATIYSSQQSTP